MKKICILFLLTLLPYAVSASALEIDGIWYDLFASSKTAQVHDASDVKGAITIQSSIYYEGNYYSVTSIRHGAFETRTKITSITIPNSVTTIGNGAFAGCTKLTQINIPNSVISIGSSAFWDTPWYNNQPDGLVYVGKVAYDYKGTMPANTTITLKEDTKGIADGAFNGCGGLTSIFIPTSVISVGYPIFQGCSNLRSIIVENGNQKYDSRLNCNAIIEKASNTLIAGCKSSIIPNDVTSIGNSAFSGCTSLTSIEMPSSVTSIGNSAFYSCTSLTSVEIPGSVTSIGNFAFGDCTSLTSVDIPCSVTSIGEGTFSGCSGLKTLTIPNSVTFIGSFFLSECSNLTSVIIPNSVTSIGNSAFYSCTSLTSVEIPGSVTSIGNYVFGDCTSLTSINIPNSVTSIGYTAFSGTAWYNNQPNGLVYAGKVAYKYKGTMSADTHINIKEGTLAISDFAFEYCRSLTSITIPNSVTSIGDRAFRDCSGLTSLVIPNSVNSIANMAFIYCTDLFSVTILNNGISIGENAFGHCDNLQEMILPQSVYDKGLPASVTKFTTYSKNPMQVEVTSKTSTSATMRVYPFNGQGKTDETVYYTVTMRGLAPGQNIKWKLDDENYGIVSEKTPALTLSTQTAKPTSTTKARLFANVNETDDDVHFGFEWLRYDAPEVMTPNRVPSPLYNGQIIGSLGNLNPDKYYKYRPYYKADDGTMFYGDWEVFLTGDAYVFYEAETHTREAAMVTEAGAQLVGVWIEGTEDTMEKGFEYWTVSKANTRTVGNDVKTVTISGNQSSVSIDGLVAGKEYGYRTYVKTESGTTYGEEKTFKTLLMGDVNHDDVVDAADIVETVNAMNGRPSVNFFLPNADLNGNNQADADDVKAIANIIMGK